MCIKAVQSVFFPNIFNGKKISECMGIYVSGWRVCKRTLNKTKSIFMIGDQRTLMNP